MCFKSQHVPAETVSILLSYCRQGCHQIHLQMSELEQGNLDIAIVITSQIHYIHCP